MYHLSSPNPLLCDTGAGPCSRFCVSSWLHVRHHQQRAQERPCQASVGGRALPSLSRRSFPPGSQWPGVQGAGSPALSSPRGQRQPAPSSKFLCCPVGCLSSDNQALSEAILVSEFCSRTLSPSGPSCFARTANSASPRVPLPPSHGFSRDDNSLYTFSHFINQCGFGFLIAPRLIRVPDR